MSDQRFLSDIELIKKASQTKKLVIFVGAGISVNSGVPNWGNLINTLKGDIGISEKESKDDLQTAQIYFNEKSYKVYIEKIRNLLLHKKAKYNNLHEVIFDLNPEYILTTNYDDLLEQVIKKRALPYSIITKDTDFPYANTSHMIVKIHGDLDSDNIVLKEDDYIDYERNHPLFEAFIKSTFSTKLVVFVGYSYSDINLKIILQKVRNILGANYQSSYLLTPRSLSAYEINYLKNQGVTAISYESHETYIDSYLNGKNAKGVQYDIDTNLKDEGLKLYKLLRFIKAYDRFKEELSKKNVVNQMYTSLNRFKEMASLPFYFIAKLYPFNNTDKEVFRNEHNPFKLKVVNEDILNFFRQHTSVVDRVRVINDSYLNSLKEEERRDLPVRFNDIISIFNYAGVFYLQNGETKGESLFVNVKRAEFCECNHCLYDKLNFKKLLNILFVSVITEISDIKEDLSLAYSNYKVGNIYKSYNLFEEIAQKAWNAGNYLIYFISKVNLKRLGHIVQHEEYDNIDNSIIEVLKKKSTAIDLDAEYTIINEISKEEGELITIIRDDKMMNLSKDIIYSCYEKIYKNYEFNKYNKHRRNNIAQIHSINFRLFSMNLFYERNYIVNDYFANYKGIIVKGLQALVVNQKTNFNYLRDEDSLTNEFCKLFILYAEPESFNDFFRSIKLEKLQLTNDAKEYLLIIVNNYLTSFFKVNGIDDDKVELDNKLAFQVNKGFGGSIFSVIFNNIFLLLSKVETTKNEFDVILKNLIGFLNVETFLYWRNMDFLSFFIESNNQSVESATVESFLKIYDANNKVITSSLLTSFGTVLKDKSSKDRLYDLELARPIIDLYTRKKVQYSFGQLISVWEFSNDMNRVEIQGHFARVLDENFDPDLYFDLVNHGVIDYKTHFKDYVVYINNNKKNTEQHLFSEEVEAEIYNPLFTRFIEFIAACNVPENECNFDLITDREDYMEFLIDPVNFDYSKFNIKWMLLTFFSGFHNRLSGYQVVRENFALHLKENLDHRNLKDIYLNYYL